MKPYGLNLKVFILISVLCGGGTEVQTLQLVRTLIRLGCNIVVICFYEYYQDVVEAFEKTGAMVQLMKEPDRGNKAGLFRALFRVFHQQNPDVVHVQYVEQGLIALMAAWVTKIPVRFATVHQLGTLYGMRERTLMRIATFFTSAFLCVSQATERSWFGDSMLWEPGKRQRRRHWTLYNCVDVDRVSKLSSEGDHQSLKKHYCLGDRSVIGIVGRVGRAKGHDILLDAATIIKKRLPNICILMIGDDWERQEFLERANNVGLNENVIVTGWLPIEEVYRLYGIMDVIVVPSLIEGFGLTAIEAMAAGLPVVASRIGGLVEIVKDRETGYLIEAQNPDQLATALLSCLTNKDLRKQLGTAGTERASGVFGLDAYEDKIFSLYQWAMRRRKNQKTFSCT